MLYKETKNEEVEQGSRDELYILAEIRQAAEHIYTDGSISAHLVSEFLTGQKLTEYIVVRQDCKS